MRSMQIKDGGGLDNLTLVEGDVPQPQAGQVLVRWRATSLNYHDYLVAIGGIPVPDGRIPMSDGAGEIEAVGEGVTQWAVGDKVMSLFFPDWHDGDPTPAKVALINGESSDGYAIEYSVIGENSITAMPEGYSFAQAATLPCAAATAWRALMVEGEMKAGDKVLIQGSGGMSIFALQIAKAAGAYVYATTSSEAKAERMKELGADEVVNYKDDPKWGKTVAKMSGGGVQHVLDVGGTSTVGQSIEATAMYGHIALIGILGGRDATMVMPKLFFKHLHLTGLAVGSRVMQQDLVKSINVAQWQPIIDKSFALEDLADAFRHQESGSHFGKIVVEY